MPGELFVAKVENAHEGGISPMASWSGGPEAGPRLDDLERLAAELGGEKFAVTLVAGDGRRPRLRVTNRAAAQITEDIYEGDGRFWWGWAEPIAEVWNVAAAAEAVRRVLAANTAGCGCVVGNDALCVTSSIQDCGVHGGGL